MIAAALLAATVAAGAPPWSELRPLYEDLHAHPELSLHETATAAKLADRLRALGFEVTSGVGGTGVVGLLRNGEGPTVMLRTELDALPLQEKTGLPFASRVTATGPGRETVPVMHACGHDVHMTAWVGAATELARRRSEWHGTLMMIAQPAEELGKGARAMLEDGLFTRFPKPDAAIAVHDVPTLPAGTVGIRPGPLMASADSVDVIVHGRGGHGAAPHLTVDPVVLASKIVVSLQTLVSRETDPFAPAVVTVGSFHAGTKHNIIPDEARLQLTVRAMTPEVRAHLLHGIARIARAEGEAAAAPRPPDVRISEGTPPTTNDVALAGRVRPALERALGADRVVEAMQITAAEDFSRYGEAGVPILMMWVGAVEPATFARAQETGEVLPGLHSPLWAPDAEPTVTTAIETLVAAAMEELGRAGRDASSK